MKKQEDVILVEELEEGELEKFFPRFRTRVKKTKPDIVEIETEILLDDKSDWEFFEYQGCITREEFESCKRLFEN